MAEQFCWLSRMKHLPSQTSFNISYSSIQSFFISTVFPSKRGFRWNEGKQREMKRGTGWLNWVSYHCHHINDFYVKYIKEGFGHFFFYNFFFSCHILTLGKSDRSRFCSSLFCALGQVTLRFTFFACRIRLLRGGGEVEETKESWISKLSFSLVLL